MRDHLDREHRQHARHQVQEQAAEQRERERPRQPERIRALSVRGGREAERKVHLHGLGSAVAVDQREHTSRAAASAGGRSGARAAPPGSRPRRPTVTATTSSSAPPLRSGKKAGVPGESCAQRALARTGAHGQRAFESRAGARAVAAEARLQLDADHSRRRAEVAARLRRRARARRCCSAESSSLRSSAKLAGMHSTAQTSSSARTLRDALARRADPEDRAGREQDASLVAVGREESVRLAEGGGDGPGDRLDDGARDAPVESGGEARLARVAPVEVPARIQVEEHAEPEVAGHAGLVGQRQQARLHPRLALVEAALRARSLRHRERIRGGRRAQRQQRCAEQGAEPGAGSVRTSPSRDPSASPRRAPVTPDPAFSDVQRGFSSSRARAAEELPTAASAARKSADLL